MKRRLIRAVLTACLLLGLGLAVRHDLARLFEQQGRARAEAADLAGAESAFRRAAWLGGDAAVLAFDLGIGLYRNGDFTQARQQFAAALATSAPDRVAAAHYNRGNSLFRKAEQLAAGDRPAAAEMFQAAVADYRAALALSPGAADAETNLGLAVARLATLEGDPPKTKRPAPTGAENPIIPNSVAGHRDQDGHGQADTRHASTPRRPATAQAPGSGGADAATASAGNARRELTTDEAERLLNEARGRETLAGKPHDGRQNPPLAKPEKDW